MKKIVVYTVLSLFVFNQCGRHFYNGYNATGPVMISNRVGESIEPEEREYYDLFSGLEYFQRAEFQGIEGGGYEVYIETEKENLKVTNIGSDATILLSDYIDNYEEIIEDKREFEDKWNIADYDELGLPITEKEIELFQTGNSWKSYGCGILTGAGIIALSSFIALFIALEDIFNPSPASEREANIVFICGMCLGIVSGILTGTSLKVRSQEQAIELIKEARKPRVVEKDY